MASRMRSSGSSWSAGTKATWSIGLGIAGFIVLACGVLALVLGYVARREAAGDEQSGIHTRATLGMVLGAVGIVVSASWMIAFWG